MGFGLADRIRYMGFGVWRGGLRFRVSHWSSSHLRCGGGDDGVERLVHPCRASVVSRARLEQRLSHRRSRCHTLRSGRRALS